MKKVRIYQLARELDTKPKDLESTIRNLGFAFKNHMSTLTLAEADKVRAAFGVNTRSRVVRNDDGVIVAATRRSEPKILGFIQVPTKRKVKVKVAANKPSTGGRASKRKDREARQRDVLRRRTRASERARRRRAPKRRRNTAAPMGETKRHIRIDGTIAVTDFAAAMSKKASDVVKTAWQLGLKSVRKTTRLELDAATMLAEHFGFTVENVAYDESAVLSFETDGAPTPRAPIVTVMGHVDHGKTSLLDKIRNTRVAAGEAGGITQHIGASRVETAGGDIVFLDTPGHEAWAAMRGRGAQVTDIVVLVVAADDGVQPTTIEAISHARRAEVPIVVALNKIDKPDANPGRVKQQLMEYGLIGEEFGGDTILCSVSAVEGTGIDALLDAVLLQADLLELAARTTGPAQAVVLDGRIDKGRGSAATMLVEAGTLRRGDIVVAGERRGRVKALFDQRGRALKEAGPSTPVTVLGLDGVPSAGERAVVVASDTVARELVAHRRTRRRTGMARSNVLSIAEYLRRRHRPTLPVVVKADVAGSVEVVRDVLEALGTDQIVVDVVDAGLGSVSESDIKRADAAGALVVGFNVGIGGRAAEAARRQGVNVETSRVIYELADRVRDRMRNRLRPELRELELGRVEVRALFRVPKVGTVAGCRVLDGKVTRAARVRVLRDGEELFDGPIASLRVHKDDVAEVGEGHECGIALGGAVDLREGDVLEAYALEEVLPELG